VLVEALPRLPADAIAVLAGGGNEGFAAELRARAETLGVADRLRVLGHVEDLAATLLAADLVVHASTDAEAFGRTVIEAQAMGGPSSPPTSAARGRRWRRASPAGACRRAMRARWRRR
jgi:glycosyltransferase involved in cell wall biosynthesis